MSSRKSNVDIARIGGFLAFAALIVVGLIFVIDLILKQFGGNFNNDITGFLSTVAGWALLISVIISGFVYLESTNFENKTLWRVLFWVFAILAILGKIVI